MTLPMIIALAVTVLMIILIMVDKLPFGAPPLLALLLISASGLAAARGTLPAVCEFVERK